MKFDKGGFALVIDQTEGMHAESVHHPVASRNRPIRHHPHDHMHGFRCEGDKIPKRIVRRGGLRHFIIGFRFEGMDQIGKLDRILNEEHRNVIADQVPDPFTAYRISSANPRASRTVSAEPRDPFTVEKRTKTGVLTRRICQIPPLSCSGAKDLYT